MEIIVWENEQDNVELLYDDAGYQQKYYWFFQFKNGHKMQACTIEQALDVIHFVESGVSR